MRRRLLFTLGLLLGMVSTASAAYTTPIVQPGTPFLTEDGRIYLAVVYTGNAGEKSQPQSFYGTSNLDLQVQVYAFMAKLNTSKSEALILKSGDIVPAPAASTVVPPTAREIFLADLFQWYGVKRAVDAGVIDPGDKNWTDLDTKMRGEFRSSYVLEPGWPTR